MKNVIRKTEEFQQWFHGLKDLKAKARILARVNAAEEGHFGDCRALGNGISEMRIHYGPGYRIYYGKRTEVTYLLIAGGDKSTQGRDIAHAKAMWKDLRKQEEREDDKSQ